MVLASMETCQWERRLFQTTFMFSSEWPRKVIFNSPGHTASKAQEWHSRCPRRRQRLIMVHRPTSRNVFCLPRIPARTRMISIDTSCLSKVPRPAMLPMALPISRLTIKCTALHIRKPFSHKGLSDPHQIEEIATTARILVHTSQKETTIRIPNRGAIPCTKRPKTMMGIGVVHFKRKQSVITSRPHRSVAMNIPEDHY